MHRKERLAARRRGGDAEQRQGPGGHPPCDSQAVAEVLEKPNSGAGGRWGVAGNGGGGGAGSAHR